MRLLYTVTRVTVVMFIGVAILCGVATPSALASKHLFNLPGGVTLVGSVPEDGGFALLSNGNYGLFPAGGGTKAYQFYTPTQHDTIIRRATAWEVEAGSGGQTAANVAGITTQDKERVKIMREKVEGEGEEVAEGFVTAFIAQEEAMGTLPTETAMLDGIGGAALISGAGLLAVGLGAGAYLLWSSPNLSEGEIAGKASELKQTTLRWQPKNKIKYDTSSWNCSSGTGGGSLSYNTFNPRPSKGRCIGVFVHAFETVETRITNKEAFHFAESGGCDLSDFAASLEYENFSGTSCVTGGQATAAFTPLSSKGLEEGQKVASEVVTKALWASTGIGPLHIRPRRVTHTCSDAQNCSTVKTIPSPSPLTTPIPPTVTQPGTTIIEVAKESPETGTEPTEETEIPEPSREAEIPQVEQNELATHYVSRVETAGFTNVSVNTIPESQIDTSVGPLSVTAVSPAPGTRTKVGTLVTVDQNPADAPIVEPPGEKLGGPTLPGFKLPHLGVLCEGFPFGVPCWLWATIESWSTTKEAPEWGLNGITIDGHELTGANFKLSKLEPIMEKVRPAMIAFATIGIVLLFFSFAKGGGPPSGGGSDSGETGMPAPDKDIYI